MCGRCGFTVIPDIQGRSLTKQLVQGNSASGVFYQYIFQVPVVTNDAVLVNCP